MRNASVRAVSGALVSVLLSGFVVPLEASAASVRQLPSANRVSGIPITMQTCDAIDSHEIARLISQRAAMRLLRAAPVPYEALHERDNPQAFHAFLLRTLPRTHNVVSVHPTTPLEFASFRAAALIDKQHVSLAAARQACRVDAARSLGPRPDWQSGGGGQCPPVSQTTTFANGTKSTLFWSDSCAYKQPTAATVYNSGGSAIANGNGAPVTLTGVTGTNGPIPGVQVAFPDPSGKSIAFQMPDAAYVPQSGWVQQPTASTFNGKQNSMYLNPSAQSVTVVFDSKNWGNVSLSGSTYSLYSDVNDVQDSATFEVAAINGIQATGDALTYLGVVAGAYGLIPTPFSGVFLGLGAVFGILGAGILLGNDLGAWGGSGGGCSATVRSLALRRGPISLDDACSSDEW